LVDSKGYIKSATFALLVGFTDIFFNLNTCSAGSQVTGTLGVSFSINHNLLIDIPVHEAEEGFNAENIFYVE
jgi:hypothetical protein